VVVRKEIRKETERRFFKKSGENFMKNYEIVVLPGATDQLFSCSCRARRSGTRRRARIGSGVAMH
jgi:hypothetical protein